MENLTVTISGPQGSGKTTLANLFADWLRRAGVGNRVLDGDDVRLLLDPDFARPDVLIVVRQEWP